MNARIRTLTSIAGLALIAILASGPLAAEPAAEPIAPAPQPLELESDSLGLAQDLSITLGDTGGACEVAKTCLNPAAYCQCVARLGNERLCFTMACAE